MAKPTNHDPRNPVASAYFDAVCTLDLLAVDIEAVGELTLQLASSESLDEGAQLSFRATALALEHVLSNLKREGARIEALCAAQRVARAPAAVA